MKKQLLTLLIMAVSVVSYAQWVNQNVPLPYNGYINSLNTVNADIVWGNPWNATTTSPYTKDFVRTTDGGNTWTLGTIGAPASYSISNIWPLNADTAFAALWNNPSGGGVWRTYDGGTTWNQVGTNMFTSPSSFANIVYFWDDMNGLAAGDPVGSPLKYEIWLTSDGGDTWTQVPGASLPALTNNAEFGITNLFDAVQGVFWFGTTYGDVYRSTDMGVTWTKSATGLPPYTSSGNRYDISDMAFSDSLTGLVVQVNATGYILMQTTDGGVTWNQITPLGTFYPTEIEGIPGTNIFVSAASNNTYGFGSSISYDGGLVWNDVDNNASHTSLSFIDPNTGFGGEFINAGGPGGAWKWIGAIQCGDLQINPGTLTPNDTLICWGDTLAVTTTGAFAPTVGSVHGFAVIVSQADISGNNDPLNDPSVLGGTGVFAGNPPPVTLTNNGSVFPVGTYYLTPVVFGNGTGTGPNITQYTLDPSCTYTGNSLMVVLRAQGDPLCAVGINEANATEFTINSFFAENNMLNLNITSAITDKAVVEILDVTGRVVYNQNIMLINGNSNEIIDARNINSGTYFISVTAKNYRAVNKLVKF